jgi:hypothetical protein
MDQKESALAFEQAVYGDDRQMVLYVDGSLRTVEVSAAADVSPPEGSAHAVLGD